MVSLNAPAGPYFPQSSPSRAGQRRDAAAAAFGKVCPQQSDPGRSGQNPDAPPSVFGGPFPEASFTLRGDREEARRAAEAIDAVLSREQPRINVELRRHTADLPEHARAPAEHLLLSGGKRLRPLLTLLTGRAFGCRDAGLHTLGAAVEMLHAATLLHDDILDNAPLRRGRSSAHVLFGTVQAVLAGDAMLAKALLLVSSFGDPRLTACVSEAVMHTAEGEIAEFARLRDTSLSHEDYVRIITGKTAWMLRASCELGALRAGAGEEAARAAALFGLESGIAFQIVDDVLDYYPCEETGKPKGGDLREGKCTPPLLLYLASLPAEKADRLRADFEGGRLDEATVEALCGEIYAGGFAEQAREPAGVHLAGAAQALASFPPSPERDLLDNIRHYILTRTA
ncbi:MAG: polyprenyl synthetase family protein [Desulfovibrio sp.]|nr:polyprenyl synthetase family protein [Desulfovibrio sp.]